MEFASAFDEALASGGPAALFLPDREGKLRFDVDRTRDCWERAPGPHSLCHVWLLLRDHDTGFVNLVLATSPSLLVVHPRADVRSYADRESADLARTSIGTPPVSREAW